MAHVVFRLAKVKDTADLARLAQHHQRTGSHVANAKPPFDSRPILGNADLVAGVNACLPEKMPSWNPNRPEHRPVIAMDFVLTASPEWFLSDGTVAGKRDPDKVRLFQVLAREWLQSEFGDCVHAVLHLDETTPHVQGFIVPNKGFKPREKLSAKSLFNPRTLTAYQDRAAQHFASVGLVRGNRGSQAEHESVHAYYRRVNAPVPQLPPEPEPVPAPTAVEKVAEAIGLPTEHSRAQQTAHKAQRARSRAAVKVVGRATQQAAEARAEARRNESRAIRAEMAAERAKADRRALAERVRDLPLEEVMQMMGCERDRQDRSKWRTPAGVVSLSTADRRFNSFTHPEIRGVGAIDLVMRVQQLAFNDALAWLAERTNGDVPRVAAAVAQYHVDQAERQVVRAMQQAKSQPAPLPQPSPQHAPHARHYLIEVRKLAAGLVDDLMRRGRVFADALANVCFRTDDGAGVEMRGTISEAAWRGWRGRKTAFTVPGDPGRAVIVESAIEALSVHQLHGVTAIATGGTNPTIAAAKAREWLAQGARVYAGQNADIPGDTQADSLREAVPGVERMRPPQGRDWNDVVQSENRVEWWAKPSLVAPSTSAPRPR